MRNRLDLMPDAVRGAVLEALDEMSRPMTVREIDIALAGHLTRSQRKPIIRALLASVDLIAVVPKG
ncbi:hypothetical protein [Sphingobium sp. 3R8]|uniref:hypothetical protein n=1 Tax=Sphingobium sp. 3R8 TaxID=2874921 RepID=UPI00398D26A0